MPCEMDKIINIAKKYNLKIVEDAAHSLPTFYQEKIIGSLDTDATVFSFYATKTITTGEGGMIVTKNPEIAKRCRVMRLHGINRDAFDRYTSNKPSWFYEVIAPGFKYNMTDVAASIGIHQLRKANTFHKRRTEMANIYNNALTDLPISLPPKASNHNQHAWHLYVIRLTKDSPINRDRFIDLMIEGNIGCSVHFIPLHLHPYWRNRYNLKPNDFPNALNAYQNAVSLPLYTKMQAQDQEKVITTIHKIFKKT
ncbi:MAG TPA: UDP-4-amino-4,6-dideoxy-N-acetyl-beta-L-altrosamine transaminase, partial [Coxiellaceae bacterium]|nr:UDP-4-amino-4,6-dideoxy-N-acetyl-beta-L-altrosamine transaminase [Coxiellaceae bacterium]